MITIILGILLFVQLFCIEKSESDDKKNLLFDKQSILSVCESIVTVPYYRLFLRRTCKKVHLSMNTILRRLPVRMTFEAGKAALSSTNSIATGCQTKAHLVAKLNGIEHRTYDVRVNC